MNSKIFEVYKNKYPDCDLNDDGIINEEIYGKEEIKVLFLLKETDELGGSLIDFLSIGAPGGGAKTWQPLCKWTEALLDGTEDCSYTNVEERKEILNRIATINLKKVPGGSTSDSSYITFASENIDLLLEQISEIPCDIYILCCDDDGNKFIKDSLLYIDEWKDLDKSELKYAYTKDGKLAIKARHPNRSSWRLVDSFWFLNKAIKENEIQLLR